MTRLNAEATPRVPSQQGLFAEWQTKYAERGIVTFPLNGDKKPAVRGYLKIGLRRSGELAVKFGDSPGLGFAAGWRSAITVLDVDTTDERVLADALSRHGPTPIVVRTASGKFHGYYRHNNEGRRIRPWPGLPIDILGGGVVVAPPSKATSGSSYEIIQGSLDDIDRLAPIQGLNPTPSKPTTAAKAVADGRRNIELWRHCMPQAHYCDDFNAMIDVARTFNETCMPPLGNDEVMKTARSAWSYTERGENWFGRRGVFFDATEVNRLILNDQNAFVLIAFLRANNGPDSEFIIANGLAKKLRWTRQRLAEARKRLIGTYVTQIRPPSRANGAALYRWLPKGQRGRCSLRIADEFSTQ